MINILIIIYLIVALLIYTWASWKVQEDSMWYFILFLMALVWPLVFVFTIYRGILHVNMDV